MRRVGRLLLEDVVGVVRICLMVVVIVAEEREIVVTGGHYRTLRLGFAVRVCLMNGDVKDGDVER